MNHTDCKLCNGHGFIVSPVNASAERCPCMAGKVVHVISFGPGAELGHFCLVCDPYHRRKLPPGSYVLIQRRAWLPNNTFGSWDVKGRLRGEGPQKKAVCADCAQGFAGFAEAGGRALMARPATHMNAPASAVPE